jgi:hypothetical protein|nr:MAG TPA: UvrC binding protein [Caudoviricetes sp.]
MYYLYKYLDPTTGECLYIGQTKNLYTRHLNHLSNKNEQWCNNSIIMQYLEVPDKYNLDFLEMYLINIESPKYNTVGKNRMDCEFIRIEFNPEWQIYTKEDFLKNSIEKGIELGVTYKFNNTNYVVLKTLIEKNYPSKINYNQSNLSVEFEVNEAMFNLINCNYLLDMSYIAPCIEGESFIIVIERSKSLDKNSKYISGKIEFKLHLKSFSKIINKLFEPTKELYEIIDIVNEFLKIIRIDKDWEQVLNYIENK